MRRGVRAKWIKDMLAIAWESNACGPRTGRLETLGGDESRSESRGRPDPGRRRA